MTRNTISPRNAPLAGPRNNGAQIEGMPPYLRALQYWQTSPMPQSRPSPVPMSMDMAGNYYFRPPCNSEQKSNSCYKVGPTWRVNAPPALATPHILEMRDMVDFTDTQNPPARNPLTDEEGPEEWRPVVGYETHYEVSSHGRVRRIAAAMGATPGKIIRGVPMGKYGHLALNLCRDRRPKTFLVHRLVCRAFHGPPPTPEHEVAHWDGVSTHNHEGNLRWATSTGNKADMLRHGTRQRGENHGNAKKTTEQVREIRRLRALGVCSKDVARQTGVSPKEVSRIVRRERWAHVDRE